MNEMKKDTHARRWALTGILAVAGAVAAPLAQADSLLLAESGHISGQQLTSFSFNAPSAGTFTVSLTNLAWPERLSALSFALGTAGNGKLASLDSEGQMNFDISSAGTYYALVAGTAQGRWNVGMYSLNISFAQLGGPTPVPLPGALMLLFSALTGVIGVTRKTTNRGMAVAPAH
jgi:hypothetical protein